jgi:dTDP-4-dehydrorhamnose reductase
MKYENLSKSNLSEDILILGQGYIGTFLHQQLLQRGHHNVFIVGSNKLNYHNPSVLRTFLLNNGLGIVINCSGFTGRPNVDEGELKKEECWRLNVLSPISVARTCNDLHVKYFHIGSGCIYDGYDKEFTEEDAPNFGLFDHSSFYSKSKHAFELHTRDLNVKVIRIRMPICNDLGNPRNYLHKILNYKKLINCINSKTYLPDLAGFLSSYIENNTEWWTRQDIYNVVNPDPLSTKDVLEIVNPSWLDSGVEWVNIKELSLAAPRSNCVLDSSKACRWYPLQTESEILQEVVWKQ